MAESKQYGSRVEVDIDAIIAALKPQIEYIEKPVIVEKTVEVMKPVYIDKIVEVEKIIEVEKKPEPKKAWYKKMVGMK